MLIKFNSIKQMDCKLIMEFENEFEFVNRIRLGFDNELNKKRCCRNKIELDWKSDGLNCK